MNEEEFIENLNTREKEDIYDLGFKRGIEKGKLEICYNLLNSFEKRIKDIEELPINHHLKIEQMNFLAGMREITKEIYILIESIEQLQKEIGEEKGK